MSPTEIGRAAEARAAVFLQQQGLVVLDQNWRNRWCEIDIVARSSQTVHFVEVKYRGRPHWGAGYDYVTRDKAQRLRRAALAWCQAHRYTGSYQIDIISVTGQPAAIDYLPNAIYE